MNLRLCGTEPFNPLCTTMANAVLAFFSRFLAAHPPLLIIKMLYGSVPPSEYPRLPPRLQWQR